ncbi:MAG TPA: hypothetical protein DCE41_03190 [Cytophagales bacterium]|nr:hypothetical protein [Cytophagales bacterium]HAA23430.1 hypothetical protein [Cytophagales bacterium]HAP58625.1 hypothetical protein [Cytophagales bacterium]
MKNFKFLAAFGLIAALVWACVEVPNVVTVSAPGITTLDQDTDAADISFTLDVPGGYASSTVSVTAGTASITAEPDAGATTGTLTVAYDRGDATATTVVATLTVTDADGETGAATAAISLEFAADTVVVVDTVTVEAPVAQFDTTIITVEVDDVDTDFEIINITDTGDGIGSVTLDSDEGGANRIYVLNGFVFVNESQTLTIEPGTIIKGASGQGENASALIVARGGMIDAVGTAEEPIIFTAEADAILPTDGVEGSLPNNARGLWGGVIVLGRATSNNTTNDNFIEGLPETDTRSQYGGTDDSDDSGDMKYVSIRHGGTDIGSGNEINGLTLGSVGNGGTFEYIEVIANKDDGVEWFGGAANLKWALVANCGDDSFDYDEGWHGNVQYAFVFQDGAGDRAGEHDGGPSDNETGEPFATPTFANFTYAGQGIAAETNAIEIRDNAGGFFYNGIITDFDGGIDIEDLNETDGDSFNQIAAGNLVFNGIQWFNVDDAIIEQDYPSDDPRGSDVAIADNAAFGNINEMDPAYDATYTATSRAAGVDLSTLSLDAFFTNTTEPGAFVGGAWHAGWTLWAVTEL